MNITITILSAPDSFGRQRFMGSWPDASGQVRRFSSMTVINNLVSRLEKEGHTVTLTRGEACRPPSLPSPREMFSEWDGVPGRAAK